MLDVPEIQRCPFAKSEEELQHQLEHEPISNSMTASDDTVDHWVPWKRRTVIGAGIGMNRVPIVLVQGHVRTRRRVGLNHTVALGGI